jgi:predicted ATP-binding protein involved in virulence
MVKGRESQEVKKIRQLYEEAEGLFKNQLFDAYLMYSRKIIEGILIVISRKDKINLDTNNLLSTNSLLTVRSKIRKKYIQFNPDRFFDSVRHLLQLGNQVAHFNTENTPTRDPYEIHQELRFIFDWFTDYYLNMHSKVESEEFYIGDKKNALPLCVKYLSVRKYQSIQGIEIEDIPVDSKFIVFTGENGEGKTSILQAIAIGMLGDYDEASGYILSDNPNSNIEIEVKNKKESIFNDYRGFKNSYSEITVNKNILGYGASRLQIQTAESQDMRRNKQSNVYGLFKTDNTLQNIEYWIKMQYFNKMIERADEVIKLLVNLMPSVENIEVRDKITSIPYIEIVNKRLKIKPSISYLEGGQNLYIDKLSAGNKSILAMIGDMIIRLYESQNKTIKPSDLYGIVLIDELETHLHPIWQKEFPRLLSEHFPKVQFILSTHSPLTFLGMPKNSTFYNVSKTKKKGTIVKKIDIDVENVLPERILTSQLFGMKDVRNVYNKGIENLKVETEQEEQIRLELETKLKRSSKDFKFRKPTER